MAESAGLQLGLAGCTLLAGALSMPAREAPSRQKGESQPTAIGSSAIRKESCLNKALMGQCPSGPLPPQSLESWCLKLAASAREIPLRPRSGRQTGQALAPLVNPGASG